MRWPLAQPWGSAPCNGTDVLPQPRQRPGQIVNRLQPGEGIVVSARRHCAWRCAFQGGIDGGKGGVGAQEKNRTCRQRQYSCVTCCCLLVAKAQPSILILRRSTNGFARKGCTCNSLAHCRREGNPTDHAVELRWLPSAETRSLFTAQASPSTIFQPTPPLPPCHRQRKVEGEGVGDACVDREPGPATPPHPPSP